MKPPRVVHKDRCFTPADRLSTALLDLPDVNNFPIGYRHLHVILFKQEPNPFSGAKFSPYPDPVVYSHEYDIVSRKFKDNTTGKVVVGWEIEEFRILHV